MIFWKFNFSNLSEVNLKFNFINKSNTIFRFYLMYCQANIFCAMTFPKDYSMLFSPKIYGMNRASVLILESSKNAILIEPKI